MPIRHPIGRREKQPLAGRHTERLVLRIEVPDGVGPIFVGRVPVGDDLLPQWRSASLIRARSIDLSRRPRQQLPRIRLTSASADQADVPTTWDARQFLR